MSEDLKCPNCGGATIDGGAGKRVCGTCGGSFTFVAGEAKLTSVGELEKIKGSVEKHERQIEEIRKQLPGPTPAEPLFTSTEEQGEWEEDQEDGDDEEL